MKNLKKTGYILITTLIMISASIAILVSVLQKTANFQKQTNFNFKKERSRLLALSAIDIALSQISFKEDKETKENSNKQWFKKLIKIINKWQNIEFKEEDIVANIKLYISCQEGKLDLNYIQNQIENQNKNKNKQENKDTDKKNFLNSINELIEKKLNINIISSIEELNNIISRDMESPLDLLKLQNFKKLKEKIFVDLDPKEDIYLTDLFSCDFEKQDKLLIFSTLFAQSNSNNKITPWLLSKSFCKILELNTKDINLQEIENKFKDNANWSKDWDSIFTPIYGKSFSSIDKEISNLFSNNFNPKSFSVVIYLTLDNITQRLFAILKRDNLNQNKDSKNIIFKIDKIYWF